MASHRTSHSTSQHPTCLNSHRQGDPRHGHIRLICFEYARLISDQAADSIERRFFTVISRSDYDTFQRFYTVPEMTFAVGRFEELELALWKMAIESYLIIRVSLSMPMLAILSLWPCG
jgi:hypothetical protein